jgi:hypothetical protein
MPKVVKYAIKKIFVKYEKELAALKDLDKLLRT